MVVGGCWVHLQRLWRLLWRMRYSLATSWSLRSSFCTLGHWGQPCAWLAAASFLEGVQVSSGHLSVGSLWVWCLLGSWPRAVRVLDPGGGAWSWGPYCCSSTMHGQTGWLWLPCWKLVSPSIHPSWFPYFPEDKDFILLSTASLILSIC